MLRTLIDLWRKDNLLEQAWQESFRMLDIDRDMFVAACRVLRQTEGTDVGQDIVAQDRTVDAFEQEVRRKVITHCAVQPRADLAGSMVLITIVIDIERIGDYTKNIVQLARHYPTRLEGGPLEADLQRVEAAVESSFERTRRCIETSDQTLAAQVLEENKWVSQLCEDRVFGLVREPDASLSAGQAAALCLYLRQLKRIHGHLGDVCTAVVNPFDRIGFKPKE